jgi:hypothetical protein
MTMTAKTSSSSSNGRDINKRRKRETTISTENQSTKKKKASGYTNAASTSMEDLGCKTSEAGKKSPRKIYTGKLNILQQNSTAVPTKSQQLKASNRQPPIIDLQSASSSENSLNSSNSVQIVNVNKPPDAAGRKRGKFSTSDTTVKSDVNKFKLSPTKPQQKKKKTTQPTAALAAIFQKGADGNAIDQKALMAEQVAAEFQAKRRLERERERERQRKRQETFFASKKEAKASTAVPDNSQSGTATIQSWLRFPDPSYVHGREEEVTMDPLPERTFAWITPEALKEARQSLQKSRVPGRETLEFSSDGESAWEFSSWDQNHEELVGDSCCSEFIQAELAKILVVSDHQPLDQLEDNRLWVDKYALGAQEICGEQNQKVFQEVMAFVNEWMVHRHNSNLRMMERQKALQKKKKSAKKKKKATSYYEDDLWTDSEDEGSELPSVFLIQGPVGSCKSSLVHFVARECDCQVLELNTSQKRGSSDLKKAIEEATQSLSSMDMLKKREATLFAKQELVDSDDDGEETEKQGASLTIVLIDEGALIVWTDGRRSPPQVEATCQISPLFYVFHKKSITCMNRLETMGFGPL